MKKLSVGLMLLVSLFCLVTSVGAASLSEGVRQIYLQQKDGSEQRIGELVLSPAENSLLSYKVNLDYDLFKDYFLSMKEMKCLEGDELWCFIPYPYTQPRTVAEDDLRWLEHDLLFMFKPPEAFGANFWNGIYYKMELTDQGIRGTAHAVDLNRLASPPDDLSQPPIGEFDTDEADLDKRWLPYIEIR
ncbi:hypothetical protein [uncultured Amphritea sp.]|uniref:hypothetical protein n=1 Tax=uncultured Amphritea sp. TaxID=981605 RepID=UPI002604935F|nr:hypothetical protein [uncultured Amphritea sp.]